tara:strand:+ start:979 stop:1182 length:204 start_codon:yes stop_codon:yes gene_type:complete
MRTLEELKQHPIRVITLSRALNLETLGMNRGNRQSAYSIVKQEFGFKGNKKKVLDQLQNWIKENLHK